MNTETMQCFLMNDAAAVLWDAVDAFPSRAELVDILRAADNQDPEAAVRAFVDRLVELGLLAVIEE